MRSTNTTRHRSKLRLVPITDMRTPPADMCQRRFSRAQAERYAANFDLEGMGFPVLNARDGVFWIVDGQHRVEALRIMGWGDEKIECEVYEGLTDQEMARLFDRRNDRRAVDKMSTFKARCTAGDARECEIERVVMEQGLKIARGIEIGTVAAVVALGHVYDRSGADVLGRTLKTLRDAYESDASGFNGHIVEGLGMVYARYTERINDAQMVKALNGMAYGPRGLLRRAESQRERTGNQKTQCVAAAIVEAYNRSARSSKAKLDSWWKGAE